MMWKDTFGQKFTVGSRVAYVRTPRNGGSKVFVVGIVAGSANSNPDTNVQVELTPNSVDFLERYAESDRKLNLRSRPIKCRVPSVSMYSVIVVDRDIDVPLHQW